MLCLFAIFSIVSATYINYDIAKKMDALQNAKFFQPYFPEDYMLKHKKYRLL